MNLRTTISPEQPSRRNHGFTMVEIAISIAVVAFALVAIMGVLPTGMTVQQENQEDTLVNQEGLFWLEAIRSGAQGISDLTNYVESITVTNTLNLPPFNVTLTNGVPVLLTPQTIIGLLSTPKYHLNPLTRESINTNRVTAVVKAMTGLAAEKNQLTNEFSFRYLLDISLTPDASLFALETNALGQATVQSLMESQLLMDNLHDLRVVVRWPVYERGGGYTVGNNRKTFRAKISGTVVNEPLQVGTQVYPGYRIRPNLYAHVLQ